MPLDPLAVASDSSALYSGSTSNGKLVATITNCDNSTPGNCTFQDSTSAGTGFSTMKLYNYIVVAEDSLSGKQPAMSQRFRTRYLSGGSIAWTTGASFRLEPRLRKAAVFLVDEAYQQAQSRPQIMVFVPMDLSGLDHDFFMQKYEASSFGGSITNNSPSGSQGSSEWPLLADAAGAWKADAAKCYDKMNQTAAFDNLCGNGSSVNATTTTVQSKQGTTPVASIDQGAIWKACRNTGFSDEDSNSYYLSLPTEAEWFKASDWGDLNHDGTIDIGANASVLVTTLEQGTADSTTVRCHTDNNPTSAYNTASSQTANCRSRYGAADMVGNVWEWTTGQIYSAVGYDNGLDGVWYGSTFPSATNTVATIGGRYDLFRGFPAASGAPAVASNGDNYWYSSLLRGAFRGGNWSDASNAGRFALALISGPSAVNSNVGGRCRR